MAEHKTVEAIEAVDLKVADAARKLRDTPPVKAAGVLSELADQPPLIALSIATWALGAARRDDRLARTGARMLAAHLAATAIKAVVKRWVDRTRPAVAEKTGYRRGRGRHNDGALNSFPSGHTAGAMAVAGAVVREYPAARVPAYALATAVALVQTPRGEHYPSDVAAGALIGIVADVGIARALPV